MDNFLVRKSSLKQRSKISASKRHQLHLLVLALAVIFVLSAFGQLSLAAGAYSQTSTVNSPNTTSSSLCSVTSNGQEEEYIYTYAVNSNNPQQAYAITGAVIFRNVIGTTNKMYLLVYVDTSQTFNLDTSGTVKTCTTKLDKQTNNYYWDAQDGISSNRDFPTVGGDLVTDSSSGLMLFDQYINVKGIPGNSPSKAQSSSSAAGPSCFVDTAGQERSSVYMLFVESSNTKRSYVITGSTMAEISKDGIYQTAFYVDLSSTTIGVGTTPGKTDSCTMNLSKGASSFEWAVRSPPASAKVPGNYEIYGTLGGDCPPNNEGTSAGIIEQFTNASYQF